MNIPDKESAVEVLAEKKAAAKEGVDKHEQEQTSFIFPVSITMRCMKACDHDRSSMIPSDSLLSLRP